MLTFSYIQDAPSTVHHDEKIKVVYVAPNAEAVIKEIGADFESMQDAVGGSLEIYAPFADPICFICNRDGMLRGLPPSRLIADKDGNIIGSIAGSFFICDYSKGIFNSLPDEQLNRYSKLINAPEFFTKLNGKIVVFRKTGDCFGKE